MPTCCTDMDFERFMWCHASKMILIPRHPVARQPRDSLPWKSWFCQHTYVNYAIPSCATAPASPPGMQCFFELVVIGLAQRRFPRSVQHPVQFLQIHIDAAPGLLHATPPNRGEDTKRNFKHAKRQRLSCASGFEGDGTDLDPTPGMFEVAPIVWTGFSGFLIKKFILSWSWRWECENRFHRFSRSCGKGGKQYYRFPRFP